MVRHRHAWCLSSWTPGLGRKIADNAIVDFLPWDSIVFFGYRHFSFFVNTTAETFLKELTLKIKKIGMHGRILLEIVVGIRIDLSGKCRFLAVSFTIHQRQVEITLKWKLVPAWRNDFANAAECLKETSSERSGTKMFSNVTKSKTLSLCLPSAVPWTIARVLFRICGFRDWKGQWEVWPWDLRINLRI